jgi:hypothetical protein
MIAEGYGAAREAPKLVAGLTYLSWFYETVLRMKWFMRKRTRHFETYVVYQSTRQALPIHKIAQLGSNVQPYDTRVANPRYEGLPFVIAANIQSSRFSYRKALACHRQMFV